MPTTVLELPVALRHHTGRVCAQLDADGGWDVSTDVDGCEVASDYCADWHRVERFRARMQHWLQLAEIAEKEAQASIS